MQNYREEHENFVEIRSELMTLEEYLEVCKKVIFKEDLGYEMDYEELHDALDTIKDRFETINNLLSEIENNIGELLMGLGL